MRAEEQATIVKEMERLKDELNRMKEQHPRSTPRPPEPEPEPDPEPEPPPVDEPADETPLMMNSSVKAEMVRERIPPQYHQAVAEGRYCKPCRKEYRTASAKLQHDGFKHKPAVATVAVTADEPQAAGASALPPGSVMFFSPRSHAMKMILPNHASTWQKVSTPTGDQMLQTQGVEIQFENGKLITDDPRVIAYLEGDFTACKELKVLDRNGRPIVYRDDRFPIISQRKMRDAALTY